MSLRDESWAYGSSKRLVGAVRGRWTGTSIKLVSMLLVSAATKLQ